MAVPSLPLEILLHTLKLSVARPGVRWSDHSPSATAAACARVCKQWQTIAKPLLYSFLEIGAERFLGPQLPSTRICHILAAPGHGQHVTEAVVHPLMYPRGADPSTLSANEPWMAPLQLMAMLVHCPNLEQLVMKELDDDSLDWLVDVRPRSLNTLQRLRRLALVDYSDPYEPLPLPERFSDFLASLPALRSLTLEGYGIPLHLVLPPSCSALAIGASTLSTQDLFPFVPQLVNLVNGDTASTSIESTSGVRHLELQSIEPFSPSIAEALVALLKNCPRLASFSIPGHVYMPERGGLPAPYTAADYPTLDITHALPPNLQSLRLPFSSSAFIAHGLLAYLEDTTRSGKLSALWTDVHKLPEEERIREVCHERRIWLNGKAVKERDDRERLSTLPPLTPVRADRSLILSQVSAEHQKYRARRGAAGRGGFISLYH